MKRVVTVYVLILSLAMLTSFTQEAPDSTSVQIAVATGLMWFPDIESLSTVGGFIGFSLGPQISARLSYWHAGISFLGISLLSIDAFDLSVVFDIMAGSRFAFYATAGAGYLLAGAAGQGISGFMASAGLGLRISPDEMLDLYVEYRPLIRNGVLHTIQGGIALVF